MRHQLHGKFAVARRIQGFTTIPGGMAAQLRVTVGGDGLRGVVSADTWAGWADVYKLMPSGVAVELNGVPQVVRYHGRIEAWLLDAGHEDIDLLARGGLVLG